MSLPPIGNLKPASSLELEKIPREPEDFTTTQVGHFCSMEFRGYGVGAKIINNDPSNTITYRLHSNRGRARIVPVAGEITVLEWFDIIIVTPNAVTGMGQLELDIVGFEDSKRVRK